MGNFPSGVPKQFIEQQLQHIYTYSIQKYPSVKVIGVFCSYDSSNFSTSTSSPILFSLKTRIVYNKEQFDQLFSTSISNTLYTEYYPHTNKIGPIFGSEPTFPE